MNTWNDVWTAAQQGLFTILIALIGVAVTIGLFYIGKFKEYMTTKTAKIKDDKTRQLANAAIDRVSQLAMTTVMSIEQETAKAIREKIESGEINKDVGHEVLCALKDKAVKNILDTLSTEAKEAMKSQISDIEAYVSDQVSEYVYRLKNGMISPQGQVLESPDEE